MNPIECNTILLNCINFIINPKKISKKNYEANSYE